LRHRNDHGRQASDAVRMEHPLTPDMTIGRLLATHPAAARILVDHRMHCVGCDVAPFETIGDACVIYGVAVDDLFAEIHDARENHG
jgi:hybrid cluster-associated redox disulfide protein